jgi:hypothetical protein
VLLLYATHLASLPRCFCSFLLRYSHHTTPPHHPTTPPHITPPHITSPHHNSTSTSTSNNRQGVCQSNREQAGRTARSRDNAVRRGKVRPREKGSCDSRRGRGRSSAADLQGHLVSWNWSHRGSTDRCRQGSGTHTVAQQEHHLPAERQEHQHAFRTQRQAVEVARSV